MSTRSRDLSAFYELIYNPSYSPSRSDNAHIEKLEIDGKPTFVLMKESTGEYYEVDEVTNAVWNLLNGRKTIRDISVEVTKTDSPISEKEVRDIVVSLAEEGTIESTEPEIEQKRVELVSAFQLDVRLLKDCSKSLAGFFKVTRRLIRKQELTVAIAIGIVGVVLFSGTFIRIFSNTSIFEVEGSTLIGLLFYGLLVLSPAYAVHELSHAAVCDYYGGRPRALGTGLYYLAPFFYVDTSDSWRLPRRARIMISTAGPLVDVVIASLLTIWSYFVAPGFGRNLLQISAFLCFYGTLVNLSPVIETDGYYILTELVKVSNLRDESFGYIKKVVLSKLGRSASVGRRGARERRTFLAFVIIAVAWFVLFAYTTANFMYVYGADAYRAFSSLSQTLLRTRPFDPTAVGVNLAALAYFGLFLGGFGVMGVVSYGKVRMKGAKLETIHDKRVSAFLPLPSFISRQNAQELVKRADKAASKLSRSYSVTLEPPLCVAAIKLGRVDQSLDETRADMQRTEQVFRSLHSEFLSRSLTSARSSSKREIMAVNLTTLARQFPTFEKRGAIVSVSKFLKRRDERMLYLFQSAFGTVWTLELSPDDYKRINRAIFPSLIAEDLGVTDLAGEVEAFKKQTVLGASAMAMLASEIEEESKEVRKRPELYQITALLEPVKSRLVFLGRTDKVEGSVVWLGGLFLYQAWTSFISEVLDEATLGLRSIRLGPSVSITKTQAANLQDQELELLRQDLERMEELSKAAEGSLTSLEGTYESAKSFHELLSSLVSDETFDIGLYKPILSANSKHLEGITDQIREFQIEFGKVRKALDTSAAEVVAEYSRRTSSVSASKKNPFGRAGRLVWARLSGDGNRTRTPAFDRQVKLMLAASRFLYDVVIGGDAIL